MTYGQCHRRIEVFQHLSAQWLAIPEIWFPILKNFLKKTDIVIGDLRTNLQTFSRFCERNNCSFEGRKISVFELWFKATILKIAFSTRWLQPLHFWGGKMLVFDLPVITSLPPLLPEKRKRKKKKKKKKRWFSLFLICSSERWCKSTSKFWYKTKKKTWRQCPGFCHYYLIWI